ncbi:plasmalemma vesicle-associated protein [Gastrophryne carolinensis]
MDPHYAMAKFGLESKDILRSKQKGCWHYTKYFFIFSSIIQFLIILGLVLFMLYGNAHVGTEHRLQSVENRYRNLTLDYLWLQSNFTALKGKLAAAEKQVQNCSSVVLTQTKYMENMNRTIMFLRNAMSPDCRKTEIENMKRNFDAIRPNTYNSYGGSYSCKILSDTVSNAIEQSLNRLRQDVNNVLFENSQTKATQGRTSEDLRKCNQEKQSLTDERNKLAAEKVTFQRELLDKTNDLNKSYSQYMKKVEELENCQKVRIRGIT